MKGPRYFLAIFTLCLAATTSVAAATPKGFVNCWGCSDFQKRQIAAAVTPSPGEADVYVLDGIAESVVRFNVIVDSEPGFFNVAVFELAPDPSIANALNAWRNAIVAAKSLRIDEANLPEACRANGASHGANFVSNSACSGQVEVVLDQHLRATILASQRNFENALLNMLGAGSLDARVSKIVVKIVTPDGSEITLEAELATEASDGKSVLMDVRVIRVIANGISLPLSLEETNGRAWNGLTGNQTGDLQVIFSNFGRTYHIGTTCVTTGSVKCPTEGNEGCKIEVRCK